MKNLYFFFKFYFISPLRRGGTDYYFFCIIQANIFFYQFVESEFALKKIQIKPPIKKTIAPHPQKLKDRSLADHVVVSPRYALGM